MTLHSYVLDRSKAASLRTVEIELVQYIIGWSFDQGKSVIINRGGKCTHIIVGVDEPE